MGQEKVAKARTSLKGLAGQDDDVGYTIGVRSSTPAAHYKPTWFAGTT